MRVEELLPLLRKVRRTSPGNWIACCPAHDDKNPSMTLRQVDDGTILMHCFSGCGIDEIAGSMGVDLVDLFPPKSKDQSKPGVRPRWQGLDVLQCIAHEALIVVIVAQAISDGRPLGKADLARVKTAAVRLNDAVEACRADRQ